MNGANFWYWYEGVYGEAGQIYLGTGPSIVVSPTSNKAYFALGTKTCSVVNSHAATSITVNARPDPSFSGLAGPYCSAGATVSLTPTTAGGTFSGPGMAGSTFTPANAGSGGTVRYTVGAAGCSTFSEQAVTVNPTPNAGFSGLAQAYCANAPATTLTPTTAGDTFGGPGMAGSTFTPASAGTGGTVVYSLTVSGCSNSSSQNTTVNPLPLATLSNNGPITDSQPTATLTAGGGAAYAFSNGATPQGGLGGTTATVTQPGPYSVVVTSTAGCSASAQTTVTGAASQSPCRGTSAVLTVVAPGNGLAYQWYKNGKPPPTSSSTLPPFSRARPPPA